MLCRDPFIPEIAVDLVDAFDASHYQALQIQFRRDPQIQIDVERVVMRDKRTRHRAAIERLHHRSLYFEKSSFIQLPPQRPYDVRSCNEDFANFRICDQVEIALPVTRLDIFETMPFFRKPQHDLRKKEQLLGMHRKLAGLGTKQVPCDSDDVANIQQIVKFEAVFGDRVFSDVDLQLFAALQQMQESRSLCPCAGCFEYVPPRELPTRFASSSAVFCPYSARICGIVCVYSNACP